MASVWFKTRPTLERIKWEPSLFALPFALTAAILAAQGQPEARYGLPPGRTMLWIVVAMIAARSCAMAFNRWGDAGLDAENPRTRTRAIPAGQLSRTFVFGFTLVAAIIFVLAAS